MLAERLGLRLILLIAFVVALMIPTVAFFVRGTDKPETWTVAAAALAVITSIISAWTSRKVIELQEDAKLPSLNVGFDLTSRYGLAMVRLKNNGGSPALNISLTWDTNLTNSNGEVIGFVARVDDKAAITVLMPGEAITQIIDVHHEFIQRHPATEYKGQIQFQDSAGRHYERSFTLDARPFSGTPTYDDESLRTHYELQRLPGQLESIRRSIERLAKQ